MVRLRITKVKIQRPKGGYRLGRLGKTFGITKDTINFQECSGEGSITGYHPFLASEINLLVMEDSGEMVRYPLIGMKGDNSCRKVAQQIGRLTGIPLVRCAGWDFSQWKKWRKQYPLE